MNLFLEKIKKQIKQNATISTELKSLAISWSFDQYFNQKNLFSLSFEEGSNVHIIEVKTHKAIDLLNDNKNLVQFFSSKNPISYNYRLIFSSKEEMNNLKKSIEENKDIENIEIRYAP